MQKILKILVIIPAVYFIVIGVRWIVAPAGVVDMFGLSLSQGVGLSSQIGDMSAFFLTLGICMLIAVITLQESWFYPPMILLALTALGRVLAWLLHDAAFAVDLIVPEVLIAGLLYIACRRLALKQ
jgi:hypothetical protein